jgi:hypothetical protein
VIFPHYVGERLVGWQHRWLSDMRPRGWQKYTNTPTSPRHDAVPADGTAKRICRWSSSSPCPRRSTSLGLGWPAVATFGATVTPEQLKLLRRFQQGVIIAPDNDKPGVEGLVKMADYLEGVHPGVLRRARGQ